jgi:hypothetical protein
VAGANADGHRDSSSNEGDEAEAEMGAQADWHYNVTLFNLQSDTTYSIKSADSLPTMKILVAIAFILIIGSLASALIFLMKDRGKSSRTVKALALRVGFSVSLFILILIANYLGWIQPTGIR